MTATSDPHSIDSDDDPVGEDAGGISAGFAVVTVNQEHRVVVARRKFQSVSWLQGKDQKTLICVGSIGTEGGMRLEPADAWTGRLGLPKALPPLTGHQDDRSTRDLVRLHAAARKVKVLLTPRTVSLVLPATFRLLRLVPQKKEPAVVFGSGVILEVWTRLSWLSHQRDAGARVDDLLESVRLNADSE